MFLFVSEWKVKDNHDESASYIKVIYGPLHGLYKTNKSIISYWLNGLKFRNHGDN